MIIEALGQMAHIMTKEKLVLELTKLLQAIMGLYKRHQTDPYHITQGLSLVLGAAAMADDSSLELHLDNLLGALFPQVSLDVFIFSYFIFLYMLKYVNMLYTAI